MAIYKISKLEKMKHLADYSLSTMFTELGLYNEVLIDTSAVSTYSVNGVKCGTIHFLPSEDYRMLDTITTSNETFMIPCSRCKKEQAFRPALRIDKSLGKHNVFRDDAKDKCGIEPILSVGYEGDESKQYEASIKDVKKKAKQIVMEMNPFIHREYICSLDEQHRSYIEFVIEEPEIDGADVVQAYELKKRMASYTGEVFETSDEMETLCNNVHKYEGCLIIKKIGQYPSMADMQFFDSIKYKAILKKNYRDYTMALGLFASGVGCGAFVYLRRVMEQLVEELHRECINNDDWNDEQYAALKFNEKIKMIEATGRCIIPEELSAVKTKIYGVLSKGVHESSEDECRELFPYVKFAIDLILDQQVALKERREKIKKLQSIF